MMKIQTLTKDVQEAKLMDAEISKTEAETDKVKAETKKLYADEDARIIEMQKIHAEISKMNAEAALVHRRRDWYPLAAGSAATLAIIGVIKLFM